MAMLDAAYIKSWLSGTAKGTPELPVMSKRARRSAQFAERLHADVEVADELLALAKRLNKQGHTEEAEQLLSALKKHLNNSKTLQGVAEESVLDIPD